MKYLLYDSIVRGAGLGHTMASYNYGLDYSIRGDMQWVPSRLICGHQLCSGGYVVENELGLPLFEDSFREDIIQNYLYEHKEYSRDSSPVLEYSSVTSRVLKDWYIDSRKDLFPKFLSKEKANICISIRRGDLAASPHHPMRYRLQPLSYYVSELEKIIKEKSLNEYRVIISIDLRGNRDCLVDRSNIPQPVDKIFKDHLDDLIFLPFCENDPESNDHHTFDFFHAAVAADFFIGSRSGFSHVIDRFYRG